MDPLSTTASIIAVLQLSSNVIKYIRETTGSKKETKSLRDQLRSCETILDQLDDKDDDSEEGQQWSETIKALQAPEAPLGRLCYALTEVARRLQPQEGLKKAVDVLKWPFNEKEIKEICATIEQEKSLLQLALQNNSRRLLQEIKRTSSDNKSQLMTLLETMKTTSVQNEARFTEVNQGLAEIQTSQTNLHHGLHSIERRHEQRETSEERVAILDWLAPKDYATHQNDSFGRREEGTGQWLLDSPEFSKWLEVENQTLFCPGIPGAGKTILASIVIDKLLMQFQDDSRTGIAYIYCNYRRQDDQTPRRLLASLLRQLAQTCQPLPDCVKSLHQRHKPRSTEATYEELENALHSISRLHSRVFIVIDALDECLMANGGRDKFLREMLKLQAKCGIHLFATSRPIPEIMERFHGTTELEIRANENDVRKYLDGNMSRLPQFVQKRPDLQERVKTDIVKAVDGMFLLAKLHIDSLAGKTTVSKLQKALKQLPTGREGYDSAYNDAMERIQSQVGDQADLAKQVLSWITRATRQLTAVELQHALAVEIGETSLDEDNLPEIDDMVSSCAGLVAVDKESNIIRLVHYTTQEYFTRTWEQWFPHAERDITAICCTYLSFNVFLSGPCNARQKYKKRLQDNPAYEYAAQSWGLHARKAAVHSPEVISFLQSSPNVQASGEALFIAPAYTHDRDWPPYPLQFKGLHLAAHFGLDYAAKILLEDDSLNSVDTEDGLRLRYLNPDVHGWPWRNMETATDNACPSLYGLRPLARAAMNGHDGVITLLLETGKVDPNGIDVWGRTALAWASMYGRTVAARLLLSTEGVNVDARTTNPFKAPHVSSEYSSRTPLSFAAEYGDEIIVKELLETNKVEADLIDWSGRTPLSYAAGAGYEGIVKLLLAIDKVDPDSQATKGSMAGRTPLSFAARGGHEGIVKLLLATGKVDPDSQATKDSEAGRTPLSFAAERGHEGIVKLLLAIGKVDPDSSMAGRTPLSLAAEGGHEGIVKLLLAIGKVDPDSQGTRGYSSGRTPLSFAAQGGYKDVVKLLLATGKVDPDSQATKDSEAGRTPLSFAAERGHEGIVKLLLAIGKVDPDSSMAGRTPLSFAAERGHEGVVKLLLATGKVDPDSQGNKNSMVGRTPLSFAAERGHEGVVKLLLATGKVDPDSQGNKNSMVGRTPLSFAAERGHEGIVKLLLATGKVDPDSQGTEGFWAWRTPLSFAAEGGFVSIMHQLLDTGKVYLDSVSRGQEPGTPLSFATGGGHMDAILFLIDKGVDVNSKATPLWTAAKWGRKSVVKMLLAIPGIKIDQELLCRTALSVAAENGEVGVVQELIKAGAEMDARGPKGRTPLSWAAWNGFAAVVRELLDAGAEVDARDQSGRTPLSWAASRGSGTFITPTVGPGARSRGANRDHGAVVELLLAAGADMESRDTNGRTPLNHAHPYCFKSAQVLLENGATVDSRDDKGRTPLSHSAAYYKPEGLIKLLIEYGAEIDSKDINGRTPLSYIASSYPKSAKVLLESGAAVDSRDDKGRTPLSYIVLLDDAYKLAKLFLEHGAEVDSKDADGWTPLLHAAALNRAHRSGIITTIKVLLAANADIHCKDNKGETALSMLEKHKHWAEMAPIVNPLRQVGDESQANIEETVVLHRSEDAPEDYRASS